MATKHVWRGSRELILQPGYPREIETAAGRRVELLYRGPYAAAKAKRPKPGQTIAGVEGTEGLYVDQTEVYPDEAGPTASGTLKIILADEGGNSGASTVIDKQITWEVEWVDLSRPLSQHRRYRAGGVNALTDNDLADIEAWKNETAGDLRRAFKYKNGKGEEVTLTVNAQHLAKKLLRGQETYVHPAPVVRKTSRQWVAPKTTQMGKRSAAKPYADAPDGYQWLTTADKSLHQGTRGKWERVQEFTGAEEWDADLYTT
ncbi:hypothetical protein [Geminisphaera colitermitum]|uniref:hypothetical protein n=1 Tax=Geminisphaera colitermitum TaxID=1148786 RepID=UPI000158C60E|nr:hypothetical protein [Geminisphaera colitermitum]